MDVEGAGDAQLAGYLAADTLDTTHGLHIQLLRRELDSGITRMNTGKFNVLTDRVCNDFAVTGHCIHLHLLGMFDKLTDYYRVLL